jgi:hypothetical protein
VRVYVDAGRLHVMGKIEHRLTSACNVGRHGDADRTADRSGQTTRIPCGLRQPEPSGEPGETRIDRHEAMRRCEEQHPHLASFGKMWQVPHGEPRRTQRAVQPLREFAPPPKHIDARFDRAQSFIDERPAEAHNRLEAPTAYLAHGIRCHCRNATQRIQGGVATAGGRFRAQHIPEVHAESVGGGLGQRPVELDEPR